LRNTLIGLCLGGALLMTGVLYWIARRQLAPVRVQLDVMQRIGAGDMTVRFPDCDKSSRNELDQMSLALRTPPIRSAL
jgi:methyl-accepting chemotaxis protein